MKDDTTADGGASRRQMLAAIGGTTVAAALAGCTAILGDEEEAAAQEAEVPDEPIEAGFQTFTEGPAAVLGIQTQYGVETAVRRINDAGGIAGREIELDVVHEGDAQQENYIQFVEAGKDVTFGPTSSGGHAAMVPEIEDQGVVNVATDGTLTTLFEEDHPDAEFAFRFQNHDVMEAVAAARTAVREVGAKNIDTVAGINPNYAFGQDEMELFSLAIEQLAGAEVVYEGYPDLATDDMSTHITEVSSAEPDVVFSSCWGGDSTLLLEQAQANDMLDDTEILVGTVLYGSANDLSEDLVRGPVYSGSRNHYWDYPSGDRWSPNQELVEEVRDEYDVVPTAHFNSGYGAVTAWATAVEKAVDLLGGWPSQEQIAQTLEGHGFFTPAGYHSMQGNQGRSGAYFGELAWDADLDAAVLNDVKAFAAQEVSPPPETTSRDWIQSW